MANTYIKIASNTVGSGGVSSITFSSIPQTYTDLVIKASVRTSRGFTNDALSIKLNNKSFSSESVIENNGTDARVEMMASLWANTSAVTSITIDVYTGNTLLQYSTFTLYGIKNS